MSTINLAVEDLEARIVRMSQLALSHGIIGRKIVDADSREKSHCKEEGKLNHLISCFHHIDILRHSVKNVNHYSLERRLILEELVISQLDCPIELTLGAFRKVQIRLFHDILNGQSSLHGDVQRVHDLSGYVVHKVSISVALDSLYPGCS
jgi:hypothetical protein